VSGQTWFPERVWQIAREKDGTPIHNEYEQYTWYGRPTNDADHERRRALKRILEGDYLPDELAELRLDAESI